MPALAPSPLHGKSGTMARFLLTLGAGLLLGMPSAQAQRMLHYTDADGVVHAHADTETGTRNDTRPDGGKSIVYRYTDAQGQVHFYAEQVNARERERLMASSASLLNHAGSKDAGSTDADPPFVRSMMAHPDARKYDALLNQAASEFGVDVLLLKAVMTAESGFNARAVSTKGAVGLMQVLPATAERYGLQGDHRKTLHQKLVDPKINIRLAARYLRDLLARFPQHAELAIASYNAGEGAVQKYGNKIPPYPETQGYVRLVSRFYQLYRPANLAEVVAAGGRARLKVSLPPHVPGTAQPEAPVPQAKVGPQTALNDQHD